MPQLAAAALSAAASYFAANAASLVISTALSTVASMVLAPDAPSPQGQQVNLDLATDAPRRWQIGKRGNGGSLADWYTTGHKNQTLYQVIYLGEGPMGNLTGVWAQGRKVYSGTIAHEQTVQITEFDSPDGRCWVTYHDGRPGQAADALLVAASLGWGTNAKGVGCAYVVVHMEWDPDTMPFPASFIFETEGAKLYDRRKDSTAGGTGTHRHRDPSTWELSSNPAVAADHYKLGVYLTALDTAPRFGIGLKASQVPYDRFAALANLCDESVTVSAGWGGGTQVRYDANGIIHSNRTHKDTLNDFGRAMNATAVDLGGLVTFIDGEAKTPVLTIDEADLIEGTTEQYEPKNPWSALVNGVMGTYQDVANNYNPVEYPRLVNTAYVTEDGGDEKIATLNLPMETDAERAQRHAFLYLENQRKQATLSGNYPLWTIELDQGDWFTRTGGRFGAGKTFEVVGSPLLDPKTLLVTINAREVDPSNTAWDETTAITQNLGVAWGSGRLVLQPENVTVTPFEYIKSPITVPGLRFTNNDYQDTLQAEVQIEVSESDLQTTPGPTADVFSNTMYAGQHEATITGLAPSTVYVVRHRAVVGTRRSAWTAWTEYTTTANSDYGGITSVAWADISGRPADSELLNSQQSWSDVSGAGIPDDNADVTGDNTAAGFTGQDWGATASQSQIDNDQLIPGILRTPQLTFDDKQYFTTQSNAGAGNNQPENMADAAGADFQTTARGNVWRKTVTGTIYHKGLFPVVPGESFKMLATFYANGIPSGSNAVAALIMLTYDGNFNYISGRIIPTQAGLGAVGFGKVETDYSADDILTAKPSAHYVRFGVELLRSDVGSGGDMEAISLQIAKGPDLAANWGDVFGTGRPDDDADVTGSNTAAAIAGQGGQATANAARGNTASRPASPPEGSWYANTQTNELQFYTGGAWNVVSNISSGGTFSATISPSYASALIFGAGTATSTVVTASGSGGTGPYTYLWSIDPIHGISLVSAATSATQSFTKVLAASEQISATAYCNVTDTATGQVIQVSCSVQLTSS